MKRSSEPPSAAGAWSKCTEYGGKNAVIVPAVFSRPISLMVLRDDPMTQSWKRSSSNEASFGAIAYIPAGEEFFKWSAPCGAYERTAASAAGNR